LKITDITVNQLMGAEGPNARSFVGSTGRLVVQVHTDEWVVGIAG
jgi:hypothetical protein